MLVWNNVYDISLVLPFQPSQCPIGIFAATKTLEYAIEIQIVVVASALLVFDL